MNPKWHFLKEKSFHIGGLIACIWPTFVSVMEASSCSDMGWTQMCGTGHLFMNPHGLLISLPLAFPVSFIVEYFVITEHHQTFSYIVGLVIPMIIMHYIVGGFIGLWIAKWMKGNKQSKAPDQQKEKVQKDYWRRPH